MRKMAMAALALALAFGAGEAAAQGAIPSVAGAPGAVRVRYMVEDVAVAAAFYRDNLGFKVDLQAGRNFAAVSRGGVQLLLSATKGPGGASQPMPNGDRPAPGGWTRIVLNTNDLQGEVERLRKAGVRFRSDIIVGVGGKEILVEDPSGNPVELFQPL